MSWPGARARFPVLAKHAYLNAGTFGPLARATLDAMAELRRWETPRLRLGVSPHAPYTVSGPLYRSVARLAQGEQWPLAVHLAESPAELEFVTSGTGARERCPRRRHDPRQSPQP